MAPKALVKNLNSERRGDERPGEAVCLTSRKDVLTP